MAGRDCPVLSLHLVQRNKLGVFYIQLLYEQPGVATQSLVVGIDPGSKMEYLSSFIAGSSTGCKQNQEASASPMAAPARWGTGAERWCDIPAMASAWSVGVTARNVSSACMPTAPTSA